MDGNGVSTTLPITFPFHSAGDLVVVQTIIATGAETIKVLNTDYTVIGVQDDAGHFPTGGDIVFTTPPPSTVRMVAYRDPPLLQDVVLQETGKIPVKAGIESPLDKLTMIAQRLSERVDRSLRLSDGDSLEMGRLPVKSTRASRYLGFDGDGNPTMMVTPQSVLTPVAQLVESLYASLPAAGSAGTLRKLTDRSRGVWIDTGVVWHQISGDIYNVKDFGAIGNGIADDTAAIQAAIDAASASGVGGRVYFPPGVYLVSSTLTISEDFVSLYGAGICVTKIVSTVVGDPTILFDSESLYNYVVHMWIHGNGLTGGTGNGHAIAFLDPTPDTGAYAPQFARVLDCRIDDFKGTDTDGRGGSMQACGIILVSTLECAVKDCFIQNCGINIHIDTSFTPRIYDTVLIDAVKYGLQALGRTGTVENLFVEGCDILNNGDSSTVAQTGWATAPTGNVYLYHVVGSSFIGTKMKNGNLCNLAVAFCQGLTFAGCWTRADNQYGVIVRASHAIMLSGGQIDCSVSTTNNPTYVTLQSVGGKDSHGIVIKGVHFRFQGNQDVTACIRIEGDAAARKISGSIEDCYFGDVDLAGPCTITDVITVSNITLSGFGILRNSFYAETNATIGCILRTDVGTSFESFTYKDNVPQENGGTISAEKAIAVGGFTEEFECTGTPEGAIAAYRGSRAWRKDGSTSTTLYVKTADDWAATGWTAK